MNTATRETLTILVEELRKGAAGPCDYWYRELANRIFDRLYPQLGGIDVRDGPHRIQSSAARSNYE